MRIILPLLLVPLLAAAPAPPIDCEGDAAMCRTVIAAEKALTLMLSTSDPAPFREHLDERAIYVLADGKQRTKAEMIAIVGKERPHDGATLDRLTVRQFGDTAIALWTESWTDRAPAPKTGTTHGMDTWVRRDGKWRIIATREVRGN